MWQQIFLGFLGLCSGIIIAGGAVGLMIGLSIVPRYAGITRTADSVLLYEDMTLLGFVFGNVFCLFHFSLPLGIPFLIVYGVFSGIFLGSWILALAEVASVFPVFFRRINCLPDGRCLWQNSQLLHIRLRDMFHFQKRE